MPLPVDAPVVLLHDLAVAVGARAVQRERLPRVVGRVLEFPRSPMTGGAELFLVDRSQQDLLVHEQLELLSAVGVRLEVLVGVALQAVVVLELLVVLIGVDGLHDLRGRQGSREEKRVLTT